MTNHSAAHGTWYNNTRRKYKLYGQLRHPALKLSSLLWDGVLEKPVGGASRPAPEGSRTLPPRDSRAWAWRT